MVWPKVSLSDMCSNISAGGDVPKGNYSKFKTEKYSVPIFANGEKDKGLYGYTNIAKITDPSITVSARGTIGYSEIRREPFFPIVRLIVLIPDLQIVNLEFLKYTVQSIDFINSGSSIPQLTVPMIKDYKTVLPSLSEQNRIVAILDQAFADIEQARAKTEQNLKNASELFESYLQQVFSQSGEGWIEAKLSDVCEGKITDGTHQTPKYFDEGYIFLSSRNVTSGEIDWNNIKYIDEVQHIAMQKRLSPRLNDILLAKNGTTGVAAIVDKDVVFDIYVSLALLRPSDKIVPRYLLHFLNSSIAKSQFNKRLKGAGVPNLHLEEIRDVVISYPVSIKKQQQLLKQIDLLLEQRNILLGIYTRKLAAIDELKKSILQKAFTGGLTNKKGREVAA